MGMVRAIKLICIYPLLDMSRYVCTINDLVSAVSLLFLDHTKATDCRTVVSSIARTFAFNVWSSSFLLLFPIPWSLPPCYQLH